MTVDRFMLLEITQEDISAGEKNSPVRNPIAIALRRQIEKIYADKEIIIIMTSFSAHIYTYRKGDPCPQEPKHCFVVEGKADEFHRFTTFIEGRYVRPTTFSGILRTRMRSR